MITPGMERWLNKYRRVIDAGELTRVLRFLSNESGDPGLQDVEKRSLALLLGKVLDGNFILFKNTNPDNVGFEVSFFLQLKGWPRSIIGTRHPADEVKGWTRTQIETDLLNEYNRTIDWGQNVLREVIKKADYVEI